MDKKQLEKEAAKLGLKLINAAPTTKKTYEVSLAHVKALDDIAHKRGIKIKDAVAEMFEMWIAKWKDS